MTSGVRQSQRLAWRAGAVMGILAATTLVQAVTVDPSGRYYRSGANQPVFLIGYRSGCAPADLDADGTVDQSDFSRFWQCLSGPGQSPGC